MKQSQKIILVTILAVSFSFASPKNFIIMIGDGCGYNQVEAASLFLFGEPGGHVFESFPVVCAMSTHSLDGPKYDPELAWLTFDWVLNKPTDSAASSTAMASGEKTYNGRIAIDKDGRNLESIMERAEQMGKMTGVVTSVQLSHATTAGFTVHDSSRKNYEAIANKMFRESATDVIMGCGHPYYDNDGNRTKLFDFSWVGGKDTWKELEEGILAGDADDDGVADPWILVQEKEEFQALAAGPAPKRVAGIPKVRSTLQQERSGDDKAEPYVIPLHETLPTLSEMAMAALNVLSADPDGFTLMVEGGAVDWAAHKNQSGRLIEEEIEFSNTVQAVVDWIDQNSSWEETLLIVTGDHETGYLTGPGSGTDSTSTLPVWNPLVNNGQGKQPGMEWHTNGHTNSLIPFYAKGSGSDRFLKSAKNEDPKRGKYLDNTDIAKVILKLYKE